MEPTKFEIARHLLVKGDLFVHVRNDLKGNCLPHQFKGQEQVILQWGFDLPVPIPDLQVDEKGLSGTLSFRGVPFKVFIHWGNVYALVGSDGQGIVYPEICPHELPAEAENVRGIHSAHKVGTGYKHPANPNASRAHLRRVV